MERKNRTALVVGIVLLMVGMSFATMAGGEEDTLEPTVTKEVSPDMIWFGSTETKATVTIEVTGDGGTSSSITPIDVVFAIDSSGSMTVNDPYDDRLEAAKDFVDQMDDSRDTGGVVSWGSGVDFTYGLSDDFTTLKNKIDTVGHSGGTNLNAGLNGAIAMLDANTRVGSSAEVIIFLTDGVGTYTPSGYSGSPADDAASKGYVIYSIGFGGASASNLEDMADATGGAYYYSPSSTDLAEIYGLIFEEIVTSIALYDVNVIEVVQDYLTVCTDTFNIDPDTITYNLDGTTTIEWDNVGQWVGDYDNALNADETVTLSFMVKATKAGHQLPVQVLPDAHVEWNDADGYYLGSKEIPQDYINVGYSVELIADGGSEDTAIVVGEVFIWQDEDFLYVKFMTTGDWYMTLTHVHAAGDWMDIPQTKKGNPIPGKFDYSEPHDPAVQCYEYMIPWDEDWGNTVYVAAHANVQMLLGYDGDGYPIYRTETAWGDGYDFPGKNWGTYIEYVDP